MTIVLAIFEKMKVFIFSSGELPLILREDRKRTEKKQARDICNEILDMECKRDWSVSLGATLDDGQKIKNYFSSFRKFFGKSR